MSYFQLPTHDGAWEIPTEDFPLDPNNVHIWKISLTPPPPQLPELHKLLSSDEQDRAQRMKFRQPQQTFIITRAVLRLIVGRYIHAEAQSLRFSQGPHGKPFLIHPTLTPPIFFNLSHSHQLALLAFALNREVGIDLEYKHRERNYPSLINRVCSDQEKSILASLAPSQQNYGFLTCWTRKEAYVKGTGKGLTIPLNSITVSRPPSTRVPLLQLDDDNQESSRWTMHDIQIDRDYTAALVVAGHDWHPSYWEWSWGYSETK